MINVMMSKKTLLPSPEFINLFNLIKVHASIDVTTIIITELIVFAIFIRFSLAHPKIPRACINNHYQEYHQTDRTCQLSKNSTCHQIVIIRTFKKFVTQQA